MALIEPIIVWHNKDTNETQIWFMNGNRIVRGQDVVDEGGKPINVGVTWSIFGAGDIDGDGNPDIVWHNQQTNETQIWFMNGARIVRRQNVVDETGKPKIVGLPWSISGVGDMDGDGKSDIVWHNQQSNETQIWFMNDNRIIRGQDVVDETGKPINVGPPWSIFGAGDMDGDGKSDIVWHNQQSNETQIWFMNGNRIVRRQNVVDETGKPKIVGLPWSISGVGDMDGDGKSDIVWHNQQSNETQIWFMNDNRIIRGQDVVDETGKPKNVGLPWSIFGAASGNLPRLRPVTGGPVRTIQVIRGSDDKVIFSDDTFFSPSNLCGLVLRPPPGVTPLDQRIKSTVAENVNQSPFKMRSDSSVQISGSCDGHAELLITENTNLRIIVKLPQSRLSLILTTPDIHVLGGSVGLPGGADPHADLAFDLELHTNIIVPPATGQPLQSEGAGGSSSNAHIVHQNLSADVLQVVNGLIVFFGGRDFLKSFTQDRVFELSGLGDFLARFNSQLLNSLPPGVAFAPLYDRSSATLILRSAP
jgi:FG-GAP-like repeat